MNIERPKPRQQMPPDAHQVFKGVIFDVYQWQQKMFDGSYETFERLKRPDTAIVIPITEHGEIIITEQEQPARELFIATAGGRVDEGEDALQTAKRELLEETGYEASEWILWDVTQPISKIDWLVHTFIAKGCKRVREQSLDVGEKITVKLISFEEFTGLVLAQKVHGREMTMKFFEAKLDPQKMEEIKKLFFS